MLAGGGQPGAVAGATDLDQPFGPAADGADLFVEGRAPSPGAAGSAKGADHGGQSTRVYARYCVVRASHLDNSATPHRLLTRTRGCTGNAEPSEAVGRLRDHQI